MPPAARGAGRGRSGGSRGSSGSPEAVVAAVREGRPPGVILVTGKDLFTRDAMLAMIREAAVDKEFGAFDDVLVHGDSASGDDIVLQAEVLPMGGRCRLVRVPRAEALREKDAKIVAEYAENPAPRSCLVLIAEDGRSPIVSALKSGTRLEFAPPRDYQLARWLEMQAEREKIPIESGTAQALAELMGESFIAAMSELRRAAVSLPPGKRVTRAMVEEMASAGRDTNPFHLGDAILSREPVRAVRILRSLRDAGKTGYQVLGMLESQLRTFLKRRAEVDAGRSPQSVVQSNSPTLPPSIKARLAKQLASFDTERVVAAFRIVRETDLAIKTGGSAAEPGHMEALVWRLCSL